MPVQRVLGGAALLPGQVILLRRFDDAITHALGTVARHDQLYGGEEGTDEFGLLIIQVLADTFRDRHGGALQFQHPKGDAVHIEHNVRPLGVSPGVSRRNCHLLGNGEMVTFRMLPVYQPDRLRLLARAFLHFYAVTQEAVDFLVAVVEATALVACCAGQHMQGTVDQPAFITLFFFEEGTKVTRFDVSVILPIDPVAQVVVAQSVAKQSHNAVLNGTFG
ncbi:Uncharacterised protein [uncultured archaeon]|nr:Uncharacterised protein [uncultured archaeon]